MVAVFSVDDFMERTAGIARLEGRFDDLIRSTTEHRDLDRQDVLEHRKIIYSRLAIIEHAVAGNGAPGLKEIAKENATSIAQIQRDCLKHAEARKEGISARRAFWSAVIVAAITAIAGIVVALSSGDTTQDDTQAAEIQRILTLLEHRTAITIPITP
jgi:hypothetical protein